jgi:hypothetical protein
MEESRTRNGSPIFYALLERMANTHDRKSHDYASNDDPYGNYHFAGKVSTLFAHSHEDAGFAGRVAEKLYRLANLESSQKIPSNESVEDTEVDICTIVTLWMADRMDRRANKNVNYRDTEPEQRRGQYTSGANPVDEQESLRKSLIYMSNQMSLQTLQFAIEYLVKHANSIGAGHKSVGPYQR